MFNIKTSINFLFEKRFLYKLVLMWILAVLVILVVIWFLYLRRTGVHKVILFSSSDCSVCQELKRDVWPVLIKKFPLVTFQDIDCTIAKEVAVQYGIQAYPTVMLVTTDAQVYSGEWTVAALSDAITS